MTCIVGKAVDGIVYMGADSCASTAYNYHVSPRPKIIQNGPFLIGFTSTFRWGDILEHELEIPKPLPRSKPEAYMVKLLVPAIRKALEKGGALEKNDNVESGGTALLGYSGGLYEIQSDFSIMPAPASGHACGCGGDVALGALMAVHDVAPTLHPQFQLEYALRASGRVSTGVCGPYHIFTFEGKKITNKRVTE